MLPERAIEEHRAAQKAIRAAAKRELAHWFGLYGGIVDAVAFRDDLVQFLGYLMDKYGDAAAGVAADFYDEARLSADARSRFRAVLAPGPVAGQIETTAGWAVSPLFGADPDDAAALSRVAVAAGRWLKTTAAETIFGNAERDPAFPTVVRVPRGDETCAFCIMLASRGFLDSGYQAERTAGFVTRRSKRYRAPDDLKEFHDDCDCEAVVMYPGEAPPSGWDYEKYAAMYEQGAAQAGSRGDTSAILAAMRDLHGLT